MKIGTVSACTPEPMSCLFDLRTSELLTARMLEDDVSGVVGLVETAAGPGYSLDDCLSWRLTNVALSDDSATPECACRIPHLSILLGCRRVLRYLAQMHPCLLLLPDGSAAGSSLLHCMAAASCSGSASYQAFQKEAFEILREAVLKEIDDQDSSNSPQRSLLHRLCLMENVQGLRPLEFAILIGAYSTFKFILNVEDYLLISRAEFGIRVRSTYNLEEYHLFYGQRRDKSPLVMLTLMSSDQSESYSESGVYDLPVMKKWIKLTNKDMQATVLLRLVALSAMASSFTPFSNRFDLMVAIVAIGYQLETGFQRYVSLFPNATAINRMDNVTSSSLNMTDLENSVRTYCSPASLINYLSNKSIPSNTATLYISPIWNEPISRKSIVDNWSITLFILTPVLGIQLAVLLFNLIREVQFRKRVTGWIPWERTREYLVRTRYYLVAYALSLCSGIVVMAASASLSQCIDCTEYVLGRKGPKNFQLSAVANMSECFAVLYIFFTLFSMFETYESASRSMAFLCICFRRSASNFVTVLPLFILWTYIVFGSLLYMADFRGQEFSSPSSVFYSPLRLLLNMANPSQDSTTMMLHTLFIFVVVINIENFLIAIISNSFSESVGKFETIHNLSQLNYSLDTWRLYGWLTRLWRHRRGTRTALSYRFEIRIWSLKQNVFHERGQFL